MKFKAQKRKNFMNINGNKMVIYEVNIVVAADVFLKYKDWLKSHIRKMLAFPGFLRAQTLQEEKENDDLNKYLTVQYELQSLEFLNDYMENHAEKLRQEGLAAFPGKFTITRRIFQVLNVCR